MSTFTIDFFELLFLSENCIPPQPIARTMFFENLSGIYYHKMSKDERKRLFDFITKQDGFDKRNEYCRLFFARFNPENQYEVTTIYNGKTETHKAFRFNDIYHTSKYTSINSDYITNVIKNEM